MVIPNRWAGSHALLTRSPLERQGRSPGAAFDLHVLGVPPAFVLSQDQTLKLTFQDSSPARTKSRGPRGLRTQSYATPTTADAAPRGHHRPRIPSEFTPQRAPRPANRRRRARPLYPSTAPPATPITQNAGNTRYGRSTQQMSCPVLECLQNYGAVDALDGAATGTEADEVRRCSRSKVFPMSPVAHAPAAVG